MRGIAYAAAAAASLFCLTACDRSDESRTAQAVPNYSEYGVVTAPQLGNLTTQPNFDGQANVTTATVATGDKDPAAPRLGNNAAGTSASAPTTAAQ